MKNIFLIFVFIFCQKSFGQNNIKGIVISENGEMIENANITIEDSTDESVLEFAITNEKGEFDIKLNTDLAKISIRITAFNYETQIKEIANSSQKLSFILKNQITTLSEVIIEDKPIKRIDTISYNANAFAEKEDRTLADILKRMPGIEVSENGLVKYQGNPINKFYVEGKDLMAGGYGTLNNSLPKDAVTTVQILEDHQPIKILKNIVPSDRAALNIKLKKNLTLTGRSEIGAGFSPFLWNAKITPIAFTKKFQYLANYKSNNTGEDITRELEIFSFDEGFEGAFFSNKTGVWLNITQPILPNVNEERYLFNKTHLASGNFLTTFKKDWEFKSNLNFFNHQIARTGNQYSTISFFNEDGTQRTLNYYRRNNTKTENSQVRTQLILTRNATRNFFKNTLTFQSNWNNGISNLNNNGGQIFEKISSPGFSLQNSLSSISIVGTKILNFKSVINYIKDNQKYIASPFSNIEIPEFPEANSSFLEQRLKNTTFNAVNDISFIFKLNVFSVITNAGIEFESIKLKTSIADDTFDFDLENEFKNNLTFQKTIPYTIFSINFINESFSSNLNLPLKYNFIKSEDISVGFNEKIQKFTVEPNFMAKYKFTSEISGVLKAGINNDFGDITKIYPSYIFSALNITKQDAPIQFSTSHSLSGNIEYKRIENNLFFNLNYKISRKKNNTTVSQNILENGQTIFNLEDIENSTNSRKMGLDINKSFPEFKSNVVLSYGLTYNESNLFLNEILSKFNSTSNIFQLKFSSNHLNWIGIKYNWDYMNDKKSNIGTTKIYKNSGRLALFPFENNMLSFNFEKYNYQFSSQEFKNEFFDIIYQYTFKKRKIDLELKWSNIFDTKEYKEVMLSDFGYSETIFQLRPSQFLASVKFNF